MYPEDHPEVVMVKHNLGELYISMEKFDLSDKYFNETLDSFKKQ